MTAPSTHAPLPTAHSRVIESVDVAAASKPAAAEVSAVAAPDAPALLSVTPATTAGPAPAPRAEAAQIVARVAEVAELAAARPGEPVRLNLDLGGDQRVEVKVAVRSGRVFADFRTDSPELRSALARGWDEFVRGREASGARWGEATFSTREFVAAAPASAASSHFSGGDSAPRRELAGDSHQHSPRRDTPQHASTPETFARAASRSTAPAVAPASAAPALRAEQPRRLSALA